MVVVATKILKVAFNNLEVTIPTASQVCNKLAEDDQTQIHNLKFSSMVAAIPTLRVESSKCQKVPPRKAEVY